VPLICKQFKGFIVGGKIRWMPNLKQNFPAILAGSFLEGSFKILQLAPQHQNQMIKYGFWRLHVCGAELISQ